MTTNPGNAAATVFAGTAVACAICPPLWFVAIPGAIFCAFATYAIASDDKRKHEAAVQERLAGHQAALEGIKPSGIAAAQQHEEAREQMLADAELAASAAPLEHYESFTQDALRKELAGVLASTFYTAEQRDARVSKLRDLLGLPKLPNPPVAPLAKKPSFIERLGADAIRRSK